VLVLVLVLLQVLVLVLVQVLVLVLKLVFMLVLVLTTATPYRQVTRTWTQQTSTYKRNMAWEEYAMASLALQVCSMHSVTASFASGSLAMCAVSGMMFLFGYSITNWNGVRFYLRSCETMRNSKNT
jgi:hypothetical protein